MLCVVLHAYICNSYAIAYEETGRRCGWSALRQRWRVFAGSRAARGKLLRNAKRMGM